VVIVETHLLKDQLAETRDESRRRQLLDAYSALPKQSVPTAAFVLDVSRLGAATLGDDATSGALGRLKTSGRGGMQDALIALTAAGSADVLVTEDGDLAKRAVAEKVSIWSFADLRDYVESVIGPAS
jgi:hypothetical protein